MAGKPKNFYGMELYEDWMDHRGAPDSQRSNSIVSRGELAKSQAIGRFQLHNAYAESVISDDVEDKGDQISTDQKEQIKESRRLIKSIMDDFGPFYDWITNGRNDDMDEETIKKLLFKK